MNIFFLLAIVALTGCQTSKPAPDQSTADNSSSTAKPSRHHVATPRTPAKDTKLPAPDASPTNSPATLAVIPPTTTKEPPVVARDSAVANIGNAPVIPPAPVTPTEIAPLDVGNAAAPAAPPEAAGRSSLNVPDIVLNPVPPAGARPTFETSPAAIPSAQNPSAVSLSRLASPAADLPAPNQPAALRLPALDEPSPPRPVPPSLNIFFRTATPETAFNPANNPPGLHLAADRDPTSRATVRTNEYNALPLPVPDPTLWPTNRRAAGKSPALTNWLASPTSAPAATPAPPREARDTLHQKFYQLILGN